MIHVESATVAKDLTLRQSARHSSLASGLTSPEDSSHSGSRYCADKTDPSLRQIL